MRARSLVLVGAALALLSLGLPWRSIPATPGYVTTGYYTAGYCDFDGYCYGGTYVPGVYLPGLPGGSYPGADSVARFFIVAAVALALIGGLYLGRARALRCAAYVGLAGIALYVASGLTGGAVTLFGAALCFWVASRDVIGTVQTAAPSV